MADNFDGLRLTIKAKTARIGIFGENESLLNRTNLISSKYYQCHSFKLIFNQLTVSPPVPVSDSNPLDPIAELDILILDQAVLLDQARSPDFLVLDRIIELIAPVLRQGQLIVLERPIYPGMTKERLASILIQRGFHLDDDILLACAPLLISTPGSISKSKNRRIVAGIGPRSLELASLFYDSLGEEVKHCANLETAEASTITIPAIQSLSMAVIQEFRQLYEPLGIDVSELLRLCDWDASDSWKSLSSFCKPAPLEITYLSWSAHKHDQVARLLDVSLEINSQRANYLVSRISDALNDQSKPLRGSKILLIGLEFVDTISAVADSPGAEVIRLLEQKRVNLYHYYPNPTPLRMTDSDKTFENPSMNSISETLQSYDVLVVLKDDPSLDWQRIVSQPSVIVDTCGATGSVENPLAVIIRI